jgi:hypothetical protein
MSSLRNLEDDMRALKFLNLAILSTLVATSAALYAQDEKPPEDKPRQEEPKRQDEAKPADKQDEMKTPRQDEAKPSKQDRNEQNKNEQREEEKQSRDEMKTDRQEAVPQGHARPAGKSVHIPDEKFHAQFGRTHTFRAQRPVVVNGQSRFVYGGYSFVLVDAWPVGWAYTDDCYIDYVDGEYFLFDLLHPGVRIALFVVE